QRLVGVWEMRFRLDQLLALKSTPSPNEIHGEIAFLANPWFRTAPPERVSPTDYGVYDVDFTPFGFDPRTPGQVPVAIAMVRDHDTVQIMLGQGQSQTVTLDGTMVGDSVVGAWQASVVHFGVSGWFVMMRRRVP
ncbi:MAG TPA: hypothetical protein VNU46_09355, partial [Gemmatimonadaceae bacterium]|nr:hypothetical protein [Gemmatimonadaceae bacterium]